MRKKRAVRSSSKVKKSSGKTKGKDVLSGAIKDLESEIKRLNKDKLSLKKELGNVSSKIDLDRTAQKNFQQKIANLIEKESRLNQRKKNIQTKIDKVSDQMGKISKIKLEMSDI